jgi:hypothetical protein
LFPKSSLKTSSTADDEIFNVRRLLLAQKLLTKTRTQGHKNHPRSLVLRLTLSSSAQKDYNWLRNSRQKLSPCCSQNHPRKPVIRLMLKSSMYVDYCLPRTVEETLDPGTQKSCNKPSSTADADIFSAERLQLAQKQSTETESLLFPKSSSKTSYTADEEIFNVRRLLLAQKPLRKTRTQGPKNHPRSPVLWQTLTSSAHKH